MNSAFEKINDMMEVFKEFRPLLRDLGSARRSPTAGSSDIDRPNPIDKVSDTAPQGPVVAPRHLSIDLACPPGLGLPLKTVRVQGMTTAVTIVTVAVRKNVI